MSWTAPKTNWIATDKVNVADYNRIKNNLQYLYDLGTELYPSFNFANMGADMTITGSYYASQFNNFEHNLEAINNNTYPRDYGETMEFADNGPFIGYKELNRIETAMLGMYNMLTTQKNTVRRLAFTLGIGGL